MANTGMQRSLKIEVGKSIAGTQVTGYPRIYNGCDQFTHNSINFEQITEVQMTTIKKDIYLARLAAFTAYVERLENGLTVATDLVVGTAAYRANNTVCPVT